MSYFLVHLGSLVPLVITGTKPKGTETEVPRFLVLKRQNLLLNELFFGASWKFGSNGYNAVRTGDCKANGKRYSVHI